MRWANMGIEETTSEAPAVETPTVTGSVGEAPVSEGSESVASSPAVAASTGVSPSGTVSSEGAVASDQASTPFPTADDFGWGDWDGEIGGLNEQVQPWAQKIYDHRQEWVDKEMRIRESENMRLQEIYQELLDGKEDPRIAEGATQLEALQQKHAELEKSSGVTFKEYEEYKAAVQAAVSEEAEAIAATFRATYPEIFTDPNKMTLFGELHEEDWDLESIPKVMALGEAAQAIARKARVAGTPDNYALQLAGAAVSRPASPRPGATITAGGQGSAPAPHRVEKGLNTAMTFDERRNHAAKRALKAVTGGKKR